jgi:cytochrome b
MPVWDAFVRIAHWALVSCVALAWFARGELHEWIGYAALGIVLARAAWGFTGPRHARFAGFLRSPAKTLRYSRALLQGSEPRYLGHNPLGGWMSVLLLAAVAATGATGWLAATERYWGVEWVEDLHALCADVLVGLAAVHLVGVLYASLRHRENLAGAMLTGRKRAPRPGDVLE